MTSASYEPPSPRTWALLTTGIALASSAVTVVGVLGFQRLHRRRRRHDLEDEVRSVMQEQQQRKVHDSAEDEKQNSGLGPSFSSQGPRHTQFYRQAPSSQAGEQHSRPEPVTPRYLAALAAAQGETSDSSRSSSPKPAGRAARTTMNARPSRNRERSSAEHDESLIREQLSRNYSFLGDEAMDKLRNSFVIVVGAGGVGSWCALMLLRSGIGRLRLIDFDQVSLSSLNRHACATLADVGKPKVQVCKEYFAQIAPWCDVDAKVEIFRGDDASRLLSPSKANAAAPTFIVDCIDNLDTKVDLLAYCYEHKIPCFSSMGAGAKADPSQIQVADLNTTAEDPLARRVRRMLRARGIWGGGVMAKRKDGNGESKEKRSDLVKADPKPAVSRRVSSNSSVGSAAFFSPMSTPIVDEKEDSDGVLGRPDSFRLSGVADRADIHGDEQSGDNPYTIMCVYSNEKSDTRLLPLDEEEYQKGNVEELAALEDFRVRILPVLGPLPAMFGLAAATYIICAIAGRQLETLPFKGRRKTSEKLWFEIEASERKYPLPGDKSDTAVGPRRVPWTIDDIAYIFEEVFRCRSVVPPHETISYGKMLRWDSTLPLSYSNVALFTRAQGKKHEEQVLKLGRSPVEVWGEETTLMFKRRMAEERRMNLLR